MARHNISSSATLFFKYFLPTIWMIFFGTLWFIFLFVVENIQVASLAPTTFKIIYSIFFFLGIVALYFTVIPIKRIEVDENYLYATNYLKIYKYPFFNIKSFVEKDFGLFRTVTVTLNEPGSFGEKMTFLVSKARYKRFGEELPHIMQKLTKGQEG